MIDPSLSAFLALVNGRRGHFQLESGHHGALWLHLDALFTDFAQVEPFVDRLTETLRPHGAAMVCGPLLGGAFLAQLVAQALRLPFCFTERSMPNDSPGLYSARYRLPTAFHAQVRNVRIAIVDDVVSAGSALRATRSELAAHGAIVVAAGALLRLGDVGAELLAAEGIPVESVARDEYSLWLPSDCPMCAEGLPLEHPASSV